MSGERKDVGRAAEQLADVIGGTDAALATDVAAEDGDVAARHKASASGTAGDGDDNVGGERSGRRIGCAFAPETSLSHAVPRWHH